MRRASNFFRGLSEPEAGLDLAAKQWICENYFQGYRHKGDKFEEGRMYAGFLQAVTDAYTKAGATPPDLSKYRGFNTAAEFKDAHWFAPSFHEEGTKTRSAWLNDLWDRPGKTGFLSKLRGELHAQGHVSATLPREKTNLLEFFASNSAHVAPAGMHARALTGICASEWLVGL